MDKVKFFFVDSEFVKTCDELVIGQIKIWLNPPIPTLLLLLWLFKIPRKKEQRSMVFIVSSWTDFHTIGKNISISKI